MIVITIEVVAGVVTILTSLIGSHWWMYRRGYVWPEWSASLRTALPRIGPINGASDGKPLGGRIRGCGGGGIAWSGVEEVQRQYR